jgi:hypothetical protein
MLSRNWLLRDNETIASSELMEENEIEQEHINGETTENPANPAEINDGLPEKQSIVTTKSPEKESFIAASNNRTGEKLREETDKTNFDNPEDSGIEMMHLVMRDLKNLEKNIDDPSISLKPIKAKINPQENYLTVREYLAYRIRGPQTITQEPRRTNEKITFLDIADAGVRGLSKLPGVEMKISRKYDENGELDTYSFSSRNLSFTREVKNKGVL